MHKMSTRTSPLGAEVNHMTSVNDSSYLYWLDSVHIQIEIKVWSLRNNSKRINAHGKIN